MTWNLYQGDEFLKPLKFSNGKTQEDVVKEVLDSIKEGHKIIFIHGICGTGKSGIALNIAKELGKTSIIVPIKNLQEQYKKDYSDDKYLLKENGKRLKISVITGRKNHVCKYLEDNKDAVPRIIKEVDSKLHDIFSGVKKEKVRDTSADNYDIPCKIEIKEKNWNRIKKYLKENKEINHKNLSDIKQVKRVSVAGVCPYWCPVVPDVYEFGGTSFVNAVKKKYAGLDNTNFVFYQRRPGCKFYEQFNSFVDSDVIVFNSLKYKLESVLNRKPLTEVEIIDECDEFLDSFSNQRTLNLNRVQNSLVYVLSEGEENERTLKEVSEIIKQIKRNDRINDAATSKEIIPLKETGIYDLLKIFLNSSEFLNDLDEESYLYEVEKTAMLFEDYFDETYLSVDKREGNLVLSLVTTNLAKRFKEIVDKNKIIILMSGTLHSENILKEVFGIEKFKVVEAEVENQGGISIQRTGLEMDCKYSNFSGGRINRENYLKALSKCVEVAKKPVLVHVNAFMDLPSEQELEEFDIDNLINREKLRELQEQDRTGVLIERFKKGQTDVLFSTRSGRGIDFPGEECNSVIFTKYPNPNVQNAFWKILHKTRPQYYWEFYKDKAKRELWQKAYRGLRSKEDHIYLLSPDERVLRGFEKI